MRGVTLLAGLVLLGSLAVPAGLLASEPATQPADTPATGEPVPGEAESQQAPPVEDPAPEAEYSRPAAEERSRRAGRGDADGADGGDRVQAAQDQDRPR